MRKPPLIIALLLGALALVCTACQSGKENQAKDKTPTAEETASPATRFTIVPGERVGKISAHSTESEIKEIYGKENVEIRSIFLGEGDFQPGIAVFPNSPNELEIVWDIAAATGNPEFIRISNEESNWHTVGGVRVGTSLEELEKINGRPFQFYGLGWDYGGLASSWEGGELSPHLIIALAPEDWERVGPEVSGNKLLRSDMPAVRQLGLRVASMVITFER